MRTIVHTINSFTPNLEAEYKNKSYEAPKIPETLHVYYISTIMSYLTPPQIWQKKYPYMLR